MHMQGRCDTSQSPHSHSGTHSCTPARSLCWVDQLTFELALMPLLLARCWMSFRDIPSSSSRVHDMATLVLWLLCTQCGASINFGKLELADAIVCNICDR
jgi:hypothetical protein